MLISDPLVDGLLSLISLPKLEYGLIDDVGLAEVVGLLDVVAREVVGRGSDDHGREWKYESPASLRWKGVSGDAAVAGREFTDEERPGIEGLRLCRSARCRFLYGGLVCEEELRRVSYGFDCFSNLCSCASLSLSVLYNSLFFFFIPFS